MKLEDLKTKKIAILWFWKEGKSTLEFLKKNWCQNISILDKSFIQDNFVDSNQLEIITWDSYLDNIDKFDYIFKTPGISIYMNNLQNLKQKIFSQTKLFFELYEWKIISITQTKWKSTTATLVFQLLKNAWFNVKLVWNIWNPVLDEIELSEKYDFVVYELSSYMLDELDNHHSFISILWNIYKDHLDWHLTFENYKNAKLNVLKASNYSLVGLNLFLDLDKKLFHTNTLTFWNFWAFYYFKWNKFYIGWKQEELEVFPKIPWEHNLINFSAILWVCDILNINFNIFINTINEFVWLPHRLQNIGTFNWIIFIDDAISTTPESTIEAIKTFGYDIWTIFLWWTDRSYFFDDLVEFLHKFNIKNIVLFPETWKQIFKLLDNSFNILETSNMQEAVVFAYKFTAKWKICLLSTASPSYWIWKNFEKKWDEFKKYILQEKK